MKFRPLHDRVVVRRVDAEEKTKGGIIIPDTAKEKPQEGEVIAAGPGARDESGKIVPLEVKAGDRILFGKWSGTEVRIDGEDLLIMKESDIMGVVEGLSPPSARPPDPAVNSYQPRLEAQPMAAKDVRFSTDARDRMLRGVDILTQCREGDARSEGPQRRARQVLRRAAHHQGRRHRRQGDRARRQVREHGRADGARSRLEDQRRRRRRHHDRDGSCRLDRAARARSRSRPA